MKRTLIILIFIISINFSASSPREEQLRQRHLIEIVSKDKSKTSYDEGFIRNKTLLYMRLRNLEARIAMINISSELSFNTS